MDRKIFFILLVVKVSTIFIMFALLCIYYAQVLVHLDVYPNYWIMLVLLIPGIVVPVFMLRHLSPGRWILSIFTGESVYTILVAYFYFSEIAHDMALTWFGHHGRFGLTVDGSASPYIITDATLPLILFIPVFAAGLVYFIGARRRGHGAPGA